jgi:O-antigen/teichoic acid export membrane protein
MSIAKRIAFGAASGWVSRAVSILLGLFLLPVLFRHLAKEELGVWLLLGQSWAVLGILDLGLGATLTRRIAFAAGKSLGNTGGKLTQETLNDIADLVETGRKLYRFLALGSFVVAFGLGLFSVRHIHLASTALTSVWLAWGILCLAQATGVWAALWTCLLQGTGYVGWDVLLASFVNSITLCTQIVVVIAGGGLIGLAVIAALGAVTQRLLIVIMARRKRPELVSIRGVWRSDLVRSMAPFALKAWITSVSLVVVLNSDQFFIAGMKSASSIPAYRATYIMFLNLQILAVGFAASSGVFIAQLWQTGDVARVQRIVIHNLRLGLSIMVTGGACLLALGQRLSNVWIGHGNYIGTTIACVFFTLLVLETQSYIIATGSRATEDEAFAVCAFIAAVLNVVLSLVLGAKYGLLGIALATLIAQLATCHWFMCYRGLQRLRIGLMAHLKEVVAPAALLFVITLSIVSSVIYVMRSKPDWVVIVAAMFSSGCLLLCSIWFLVMDQSQRKRAVSFPSHILRVTLG